MEVSRKHCKFQKVEQTSDEYFHVAWGKMLISFLISDSRCWGTKCEAKYKGPCLLIVSKGEARGCWLFYHSTTRPEEVAKAISY